MMGTGSSVGSPLRSAPPLRRLPSAGGFDTEQLDREQQGRAARDRTLADRAIGELPGDREFDLVADAHQLHAFLPAVDHAVERKGRRFAARDRAVELAAVGEGADIMDGDLIDRAGVGAAAVAGDAAPATTHERRVGSECYSTCKCRLRPTL